MCVLNPSQSTVSAEYTPTRFRWLGMPFHNSLLVLRTPPRTVAGWSAYPRRIVVGRSRRKKWNKHWTAFFSLVGMHSLFIYLFAHLDGAQLIEHILHPFTYALFDWGGPLTAAIITSALVWAALWGLCYWMYCKRMFIKI
jgi:hypothetical protein